MGEILRTYQDPPVMIASLVVMKVWAINNLMLKNPHNADTLAAHGLCELLVKLLLKYKTNAEVCFVACITILKVCHRKVYQDQLIDLHLKGVLKLLLSMHTQYSPLHDVIYDVLHEI